MASIDISGVGKSYKQVRVLQGLDLSIAEGEFISFLGPSGCGKSTLLYCIAGLEEINRGTISFDGKDITDLSPRERNVALVFQDYALYPHMNVRENIRLSAAPAEARAIDHQRQVDWAAETLGLASLLDACPSELRVASASASPSAGRSYATPLRC